MFKPTLLAACAAACSSLPVFADTELPARIVTASRITGLPAGTPVYILDRQAIQDFPGRNLMDVLATLPGIAVRRLGSSADAAGTLDLRGFGAAASNNVLVLLDGRRLNDIDSTAADLSGIPLENIERIEFLPGGGSVLYGDGAGGGTVNLITRNARANGATLHVSGGSHDARHVSGNLDVVSGQAGIRVFGQHMESDGYRENAASRLDEISLDAETTRESLNWFLKADAAQRDNRLPGPRKVDMGTGLDEVRDAPAGTSEPHNYAEEDRHRVLGGWKLQLGQSGNLIVDAGQRRKQQRSFFDYGFGFSDFTDTTLETTSATPRLLLDYNAGGMKHQLRTGIDLYRSDYVSLRGQRGDTAPIHTITIESDSRSAYLFQSSQVNDTTVTVGGRKTRVTQNGRDEWDQGAPGSSPFDSEAMAGNQTQRAEMYEFGLSQAIGEQWTVMANTSRSVRLGTVDEVYEYDAFFQRVFSPLLPQVGKNVELSAQWAADAGNLTLTLYRQKLENEIHFNPVTFTNDNLDPTERKGATVSGQFTPMEMFRLDASLTVQQARFRDGPFSGKDMPLVAGELASLTLTWKPDPRLSIALGDTYTGKRYMDNDQSNTFQQIPAQHRLDLKMTARLASLTASLEVFNLQDDRGQYDYAVRSTTAPRYNAYPLSGREYRLGLGYRF